MPRDQNGIIRGYNISVNTSGDATDLFTEDTSIVLVDLEKFTYYNISVGATTVNGTGPLSFTVIQTDSDGTFSESNTMHARNPCYCNLPSMFPMHAMFNRICFTHSINNE